MAATGQIDYVEFPAIDIAKTKKFYSDVFGWKFEDYGPDYTSFTDGRLAGGFYSDPRAETHRPLVVIYAEDLEALEAKVKLAGGNIVKPTFSQCCLPPTSLSLPKPPGLPRRSQPVADGSRRADRSRTLRPSGRQ